MRCVLVFGFGVDLCVCFGCGFWLVCVCCLRCVLVFEVEVVCWFVCVCGGVGDVECMVFDGDGGVCGCGVCGGVREV